MSAYNCPCCTRPLCSNVEESRVVLYCSHGPCECYAMNDGETGENAKEAYDKLVAQYELWAENQPKV